MKKNLKLLGIGLVCSLISFPILAAEIEDNIEIDDLNPATCKKADDEWFADIKTLIQYIKDDKLIERCDNPSLKIRTTIDSCDLEGWYYDKGFTNKVTGTVVGDVIGEKEIKTDANGCVTNVNYITNVYAKCKAQCPVDMDLEKRLMYNNEGTVTKVTVSGRTNLLTPTKDGYIFDGWYYDDKFTNKVNGNTTDSVGFEPVYDENNCLTEYKDVTLYAKWIKIPETCTNNVNRKLTVNYMYEHVDNLVSDELLQKLYEGFEKVTVDGKTYMKGNEIYDSNITTIFNTTDSSITVDGYKFDGWYYDTEYTNKAVEPTLVQKIDENSCLIGYEDITVYGRWVKQEEPPKEEVKVKNPETGDNIVIYGVCGVILIAGCVLVIKKLTVNKK